MSPEPRPAGSRRWRRWCAILGLALLIGVLLALPEARCPLLGWWRNEAFYEGMPASWWEGEVRDSYLCMDSERGPVYLGGPVPSVRGRLAGLFGEPEPVEATPPLLSGNVATLPVLATLLKSKDVKVRAFAIEGIVCLGRKGRLAVADVEDALQVEEDGECRRRLEELWKKLNPSKRRRPGLRANPS